MLSAAHALKEVGGFTSTKSTCLLVQKYLLTSTKVQILTQHPLSAAHALKEGEAAAGGAVGVGARGVELEEKEEDGISDGVRGDLWEIDPQLGTECSFFSLLTRVCGTMCGRWIRS